MAKKELTKSQIIAKELLENQNIKTYEDVKNLLNNLQSDIIQTLLEEEMNTHIGSKKGKHNDNSNIRNGYSSRNKIVKTDSGAIKIDMPRDRDGSFDPQIVKKRQKLLSGIDEVVTAMYAKGNSLDDISSLIEKIYKIKLSKETLSNMTESVNEKVLEWQKKPLKKAYAIVYIDCLYCNIKEDYLSVKKAIYVAIGISLDNTKEVLGVYIDSSESASFWQSIFEDFKSRGTEDIFFVCMDGLKGLSEAVERVFPYATIQRCIVHICRNIYGTLNKKDAKEIMHDFKKIYTASNKSNAEAEYENFVTKYKENKKLINKVNNFKDDILAIFNYTPAIRKMIYTTNAIESVNSCLRKVTKGKGSFISEKALMKVLYLRIQDLELKWKKGVVNFTQLRNELYELYPERIKKYII